MEKRYEEADKVSKTWYVSQSAQTKDKKTGEHITVASTILYLPRDPAHPKMETGMTSKLSTIRVHDRALDSSRMGDSLARPKTPKPKRATLATFFYWPEGKTNIRSSV